MGFKSVEQYNEEKYGNKFILQNDGDNADVVFLYKSPQEAVVADTHYIKSAEYSGYVHCCGKGCPACAKQIRVQTKLFIPLYNINDGALQFWDRSTKFSPQLFADVLSKFPNPSEYVFRITRHGVAGDINTRYEINVIAKNTQIVCDTVLKKPFPEYFEDICKDVPAIMMQSWLDASGGSNLPEYTPMPRASVSLPDSSSISSSSPSVLDSISVADEELTDDVDFD